MTRRNTLPAYHRRARQLPPPANSQRGLVLFIALIVLVAMTMAGIGMVRSVDTSNVIAGNLAFKQGTIQTADRGIESGVQWLIARATGTTLQITDIGSGYYSAKPAAEPDWSDPNVWANAACVNGCAPDPATGNVTRYFIHRMCTEPDTPPDGNGPSGNPNHCMKRYDQVGKAPGGSKKPGPQFEGTPKLFYRVTARVDGPRNTSSVVQTTVAVRS
jgi:type IV pilus assembly protein PilX